MARRPSPSPLRPGGASRSTPALLARALAAAALLAATACGGPGEGDPEDLVASEKLLTSHAIGEKALPVDVDTATQVWAVTASWSDTGTAAARAAGLAWPANSGLRWDEKYARWVESLPAIALEDGSRTFQLVTPYGKTLRMPALECSEQALLLRAVFASWYGLPFFVEASDGSQRIFLGHFGFRTAAGRYRGTPNFKLAYADYSSRGSGALSSWPHDAALRARHLTDSDGNEWLGRGAGFGAWADEALLNKRAGWMLLWLLDWFGSVHLASAANAYHLVPDALRAGDVLVQRWQKSGAGHVLVPKHLFTEQGKPSVEVTSGSMPRRPPRWDDALWSRNYFLADISGGPGNAEDGTPYARLGGGLRRFRVAQAVGGFWVNDVPSWDVQRAIDEGDLKGIAARPAQLDQLLYDVPPGQKAAALAAQIAQARKYLEARPASCPLRTQREALFAELYKVSAERLGMTRAQVDAQQRATADWFLPELRYTASPTCCWDTTTAQMYSLIERFNREREAGASACLPPLPFVKANYAQFKAYAQRIGEAASWRDWSEDEPCAWRAAADDVQLPQQAGDYCAVKPALDAGGR